MLIALLWILIFIFRFKLLTGIVVLIFDFVKIFLAGENVIINQLNFNLADHFAGTILFFLLPLLFIYLLRRKTSFIYSRLSINNFVVIVLAFAFLFAPLISNYNPEFQKNIGITKLLPPLSSVKSINIISDPGNEQKDEIDDFIEAKKNVINEPVKESLIFIDSIKINSSIVAYQNNKEILLNKNELELVDGTPVVSDKIFWLGTDEFGRDIFSRINYGARVSLFIGIAAVSIALLIGLSFGFLAGIGKGITANMLNRFTDLMLSFPIIFLIILILALFGNNLISVIVVLGFSGWMSLFKIVKAETTAAMNKEFFITSQQIGISKKDLLLKDLLPLIIAPVTVNLVFLFSSVILAESALSYLGLGAGFDYPSWGKMIESGQDYIYKAWWLILFPGLVLVTTLLSVNRFGKELSIKLNPRLKA